MSLNEKRKNCVRENSNMDLRMQNENILTVKDGDNEK